jgi:hypothetical protein
VSKTLSEYEWSCSFDRCWVECSQHSSHSKKKKAICLFAKSRICVIYFRSCKLCGPWMPTCFSFLFIPHTRIRIPNHLTWTRIFWPCVQMAHGSFLTKQVALRTQMPQLHSSYPLIIHCLFPLHWSLYNLLGIHNAFITFTLNYKIAIQASKRQPLKGTSPWARKKSCRQYIINNKRI